MDAAISADGHRGPFSSRAADAACLCRCREPAKWLSPPEKKRVSRFHGIRDERGQTFVEYAVILVMIAALVLAGWTQLSGAIAAAIATVVNAF